MIRIHLFRITGHYGDMIRIHLFRSNSLDLRCCLRFLANGAPREAAGLQGHDTHSPISIEQLRPSLLLAVSGQCGAVRGSGRAGMRRERKKRHRQGAGVSAKLLVNRYHVPVIPWGDPLGRWRRLGRCRRAAPARRPEPHECRAYYFAGMACMDCEGGRVQKAEPHGYSI